MKCFFIITREHGLTPGLCQDRLAEHALEQMGRAAMARGARAASRQATGIDEVIEAGKKMLDAAAKS